MACKQYYPDAEVFGRYDKFWQPTSIQSGLQGQVGARINVPIYRNRLIATLHRAAGGSLPDAVQRVPMPEQ